MNPDDLVACVGDTAGTVDLKDSRSQQRIVTLKARDAAFVGRELIGCAAASLASPALKAGSMVSAPDIPATALDVRLTPHGEIVVEITTVFDLGFQFILPASAAQSLADTLSSALALPQNPSATH